MSIPHDLEEQIKSAVSVIKIEHENDKFWLINMTGYACTLQKGRLPIKFDIAEMEYEYRVDVWYPKDVVFNYAALSKFREKKAEIFADLILYCKDNIWHLELALNKILAQPIVDTLTTGITVHLEPQKTVSTEKVPSMNKSRYTGEQLEAYSISDPAPEMTLVNNNVVYQSARDLEDQVMLQTYLAVGGFLIGAPVMAREITLGDSTYSIFLRYAMNTQFNWLAMAVFPTLAFARFVDALFFVDNDNLVIEIIVRKSGSFVYTTKREVALSIRQLKISPHQNLYNAKHLYNLSK